eukprot:Hpha_TRINITY_DN16753_c2_g9::TRINITY_DN16753_c2_g9_i1::g.77736::m.77736
MAKAVLGPVIGTVTESTARVMYEFSEDCEVTVTVTSKASGESVSCTKEAPANLPCIFTFEGLEPAVRYTVEQDAAEAPHGGGFTTVTGNLAERPFTIAAVSCNKAHVIRGLGAEEVDLWDDLAQRCEAGDIDLIIHMGDQIYADEIDQGIEGGDPRSVFSRMLHALYEAGSRWVKNEGEIKERMVEEGRGDSVWVLDGQVLPPEEWEGQRERILDEYRGCYRDTWGHLPCRRALAYASNLMICDDHDISDDWGDRPYHRVGREPQTPEVFIGTLGLQAYHEYQRQLREDVEVGAPIEEFDNEGYTMRYGDVGVMMVDMRGPRSFRCPPDMIGADADPPLICDEQWAMIETALGEWSDVKTLVFCTPVPPVLFSKSMTQLGAKFVNDTAGQFTFAQEELLIKLLDTLLAWKRGGPQRDLCIYTGDIHVGQHTEIKYDGEVAFNQLIASSVGNHGAGASGCLVMSIMGDIQSEIDDHWSFNHHTRVPAEAQRNYGISRLKTWKNAEGEDVPVMSNYHVMSIKDKCLTPDEIASKVGQYELDAPGLVSVFGVGSGARRYTYIGGSGMGLGDLIMRIPGDDERGASGWNPFSSDQRPHRGSDKLPDVPDGFKVGLEPQDGLARWEVRCADDIGNYIVRADDEETKSKFPAGVKQAEFYAENLDPSTEPGEGIAFVRWRHDDGFASTSFSAGNYKDDAWTILYALQYPQE